MAKTNPDRKVYGANMGPIWGRQDPCWPHELCSLGRDCDTHMLHFGAGMITSCIGNLSALQVHLCGESMSPVDSLTKQQAMRGFNACVAILNRLSNKQSRCRWFEMPWLSCDVTIMEQFSGARGHDKCVHVMQPCIVIIKIVIRNDGGFETNCIHKTLHHLCAT